jgi:hypothetical protein
MRSRVSVGALLLLVTLGLLGALQYRWLREVADAQRTRMRSDAALRALAIGQDFDREITRAFLSLPLDGRDGRLARRATAYAARFEEFERASRQRGLVKHVYLVEPKKQAAGEWEVLRFSRESGAWSRWSGRSRSSRSAAAAARVGPARRSSPTRRR